MIRLDKDARTERPGGVQGTESPSWPCTPRKADFMKVTPARCPSVTQTALFSGALAWTFPEESLALLPPSNRDISPGLSFTSSHTVYLNCGP